MNFESPKKFYGNLTIDDLDLTNVQGFDMRSGKRSYFCESVRLHPDSKVDDFQEEFITAESLVYTGKYVLNHVNFFYSAITLNVISV